MRTLDGVLRQFGLDASIAPIRRGRVNKHWRVDSGQTSLVLRRYRPERSAATIEYEHNVLDYAAAQGWPVAPAIPAMNGQRVVDVNGRRYTLFPRLTGRMAPYSSIRRSTVKGGLLARFHNDMASWDAPGQREGFGMAWELDLPTRALTQYPTFNEMLRDFEREHRDLARALRRARYDNLRSLSRLGYGTGPRMLIHGDFHHDNLLFTGETLTGLLDFDAVRVDERVADVAASVALDCLAPPAYNELRPVAVEAFIAGYVEARALSQNELALIPPLIQSWILGLVTFQMCGWFLGGGERALRSIARSVMERLPNLRRDSSRLDDAIQRGASHGEGPAPAEAERPR